MSISKVAGVACKRVTFSRSTISRIATGSRCVAAEARQRRAPVANGKKSSSTDMSKQKVVSPSTVWPGPNAPPRRWWSKWWRRLTTPRCSTMTPLGFPVDPLV